MTFDLDNTVVRLCAEGMAVEGDPAAARALFAQAWDARRDDLDACIAAHFLARHQETIEETLHWNALAVSHAEALRDGRANALLSSLFLSLGESLRVVGRNHEAAAAADRARESLCFVAVGGYRNFVAMGIERLSVRLCEASLTCTAAAGQAIE